MTKKSEAAELETINKNKAIKGNIREQDVVRVDQNKNGEAGKSCKTLAKET